MPVFVESANTMVHWVAQLDSGGAVVLPCAIYDKFAQLFQGGTEQERKEVYDWAFNALKAEDVQVLYNMGFEVHDVETIVKWLERHIDFWKDLMIVGRITGLPLKFSYEIGTEDVRLNIEDGYLIVIMVAQTPDWQFVPEDQFNSGTHKQFTPKPGWTNVHTFADYHWEGSTLVDDKGERHLVLAMPKD